MARTRPAWRRARCATATSYVLNGGKMWITNGNLADVALVWAKVAEDGQDTVRGFLVDTDTRGLYRQQDQAQAELAGVGDQRAGAAGRAGARRRACCRACAGCAGRSRR